MRLNSRAAALAIVIAAVSAVAIAIYFVRSAPSELAVCSGLSERLTARVQAARDAEPKDPAWAYSMEQNLREYTSHVFQQSRIQVIGLDCKTTFCEISAHGFVPETAHEFSEAVSAIVEQPWNDFTDQSVKHDTDFGKGLHYVRFSGRQSNPTLVALDDARRAALLAEEQAVAVCITRALEPKERGRAARETEPRDSSWADPMEQLLRQQIEKPLGTHPVASLDIACRATFCEIKATGKTADSRMAFEKAVQEAAAEPWADLSAVGTTGGATGYGWHAEVTLNRRNSSR